MRVLNASLVTVATAALIGAGPLSANATPANPADQSSHAAPAAQKVDDSALQDRIEAYLKRDAALEKYDIDVSVKNGVATLAGKVRTKADQARAGRVADIGGITSVENKLTIDADAGRSATDELGSAAKTAGQKTKSAAKTAGEKTKSAAETAGEKTENGVNKAGQVVNDAWITTKVHSRFTGEDLLKGSDIDVDTNEHVVTLKGTVPTSAARTRALEIARTTDGVTKVVDQLTIK